MSGRSHEDFGREEHPGPGSERGFGIVFAILFAILAFWGWGSWGILTYGFVGACGVFLFLAMVWPGALKWPNIGWFYVGLGLGKIVTPLVMGIIFFLVVTPIALLRKLLGKRSMPVQPDPDAKSYWQDRDEHPAAEQWERQF